MTKSTGGRECKIHDDHLERLGGVTFGINDLFFNKVNNERIKKVRRFAILSAVELTEMRDGEVVMLDQCHAVINPLLVENFIYSYTKPVNLSVYSSIHWQAGIARKLYTRLDTQFSHHNRFEMTTERFFRESGIVGSKYKKPSARKQNLEKAIKQLLGKKFTSNKIIKGYKFEKTTDGKDWKVIIWAHQMAVVGSPHVEAQPAPKKANTSKSKQPKSKEASVKPIGLLPINETIKAQVDNKKSVPKSSKVDVDIKTFLNTFIKLFPKAEEEKLYRSRPIKAKVKEFLANFPKEKALDFLVYCAEISKQNQFSALNNAQTPKYLFSFKVGDDLLTTVWQRDRAAAIHRKQEEQAQAERTKNYQKDIFTKQVTPEYDEYINHFIEQLSENQASAFEEYFQQRETETLTEKGEVYQKMYSKSKLLQKQLSFTCLQKFSQKSLPQPVFTFEEWVRTNYPEEYKKLY